MSPLGDYDVLLLDLDGVVYRGLGPVPHAVEVLRSAEAAGVRLGFVTNNASRTPEQVAEHLTALGLACGRDQVVTSAQVGADVLAERVAAGRRILAVGGEGVAAALLERDFIPVTAAGERSRGRTDLEIATSVAGVLQGFGPEVSWRDLAVASYAVAAGRPWVATNTDRTIPRADGIAPGNGMLVAAVTAATGVTPPAAGKPAPEMMQRAAHRLRAARPLAVGDRLDTDIRGAVAAGIDSLLVLTGVTGAIELAEAQAGDRPTYVAADLRGLQRDLPRLTASSDGPWQGEDARIAQAVRMSWGRGGATAELKAILGGAGSR